MGLRPFYERRLISTFQDFNKAFTGGESESNEEGKHESDDPNHGGGEAKVERQDNLEG